MIKEMISGPGTTPSFGHWAVLECRNVLKVDHPIIRSLGCPGMQCPESEASSPLTLLHSGLCSNPPASIQTPTDNTEHGSASILLYCVWCAVAYIVLVCVVLSGGA